jgi:hypothetical protein
MADLVSPEMVGYLAVKFSQPEDAIQRGLRLSLAAIVCAMSHKAEDREFFDRASALIASVDPSLSGEAGLALIGVANRLLHELFGAGERRLAKIVAEAAALDLLQAKRLLRMAALMMVGLLAQRASVRPARRVLAHLVRSRLFCERELSPRLAAWIDSHRLAGGSATPARNTQIWHSLRLSRPRLSSLTGLTRLFERDQ